MCSCKVGAVPTYTHRDGVTIDARSACAAKERTARIPLVPRAWPRTDLRSGLSVHPAIELVFRPYIEDHSVPSIRCLTRLAGGCDGQGDRGRGVAQRFAQAHSATALTGTPAGQLVPATGLRYRGWSMDSHSEQQT